MSVGNYCDIYNTIRAIMLLLIKGESGECCDIVNEKNTKSIKDMAHIVADEILGSSIKVIVRNEKPEIFGYPPEMGWALSGEKIQKIGWYPKKFLKEMYMDIISELRSHYVFGRD